MNRKELIRTVIAASVMAATFNCATAADETAATLVRIEGEAVVSKGAQYVGGTEGMALKVGERVMALAASTATIQFNDGCRYVLEANQLLTVDAMSPCALGVVPAGQAAAASTAGATGGIAGATAASLGWVPAALGGVVAVGATVDYQNNDTFRSRPPISP